MKNIKLSIELGSDVTKFDRTVNEAEFGDASKYVPGRKINLIILVPTVDRRDNEKVVKLSSLELKRAGRPAQRRRTTAFQEQVLENANQQMDRRARDFDANLMSITNNIDIITGMDIVGKAVRVPFCGVVFASEVEEEAVFLPALEADLRDLLSTKKYVLLLLFAFRDHLDKQAQVVNSACAQAQ
ncbi:hypothetical protein BJV82DRAFT_709203 [Fennellomyces sp. T-0311]|nr:hypothetical protein BJV82DRAFT_709203 [Fennellomyces sp. T-0311]